MMNRGLYTQACLLLLASCSRTHQDGVSTETGNPPVIERDRIALVLIDGEAHVVGEPGAIDPPRGEVEVTIERTSESARTQVEGNGSFDVEVEARLGDAFSVRVIVEGTASARVRFAGSAVDSGMSEPADSGPIGADDAAVSDAGDTCQCLDDEIRWRRVDPDGVFPELPGLRFTLRGCNTFMTQNDALEKCTRSVEQCPGGMGSISIADIKAALSAEPLQDALDQGGVLGEPESTESYMYEISVGDRTFTYRSCHAGTGVEIPCVGSAAIEGFVVELTQLADAYACAPEPDCDSPFDPGTGEATEWLYWHEPESGGCLPVSGSLEGASNGNRYDSAIACLDACPMPASQADCADGRTFIEGICPQCGFVGGCLYQQNYCASTCEADMDCKLSYTQPVDSDVLCSEDMTCTPTFVGPCL
jgi:hypothetical protein